MRLLNVSMSIPTTKLHSKCPVSPLTMLRILKQLSAFDIVLVIIFDSRNRTSNVEKHMPGWCGVGNLINSSNAKNLK